MNKNDRRWHSRSVCGVMGRRIDIELTSKVDDETWTWRAAGAKQPKGTLAPKLLYDGAKVGDVVRAEVENDIDGIVVLLVLPPKEKRAEAERLEMLAPVERRAPVTPPAPRRDDRGPRPPRDERGPRPPRDERDKKRAPRSPRDTERGRRAPGDTERGRRAPGDTERAPRAQRPARPKPEPVPERPKPKRLNPGHVHRNAVLESRPPEHQPIAEHVLRGGIPAVRQAIETQNATLKSDNQPPIKAEPLLALAEDLLPALKTAEWRDRADAATAAGDDISLRDLRSVVTGADVARDDESRLLARTLRESLDARLKAERDTWLNDIGTALTESRVVRALRIASRPPDPAMRFPADLGARLAEAAGSALSSDAPPDRWLAVLDAVQVSPVRRSVQPAGLPPAPPDAFISTLKTLVPRVPALGPLVGIDPKTPPPPPGKRIPAKPSSVSPEKTEEPRPAADTDSEKSEGESQNGNQNAPSVASD